MVLIECHHNNYEAGVGESYDRISLRLRYELIPRLIHQDTTINLIRSYTALSNPINPFCPYCVSNIINTYASVGSSVIQDAHMFLEHIRSKVREEDEKLEQINIIQGRLSGERRSGTSCHVIVDVLRYNDIICTDIYELVDYYLLDGREAGLIDDVDDEYFVYMPRPNPAARWAVDELERVDMAEVKEDNCVMCLEGLLVKEKKEVVRMPCKHEFHEDCIVEWLSSSHLCPLCRFELPIQVSN